MLDWYRELGSKERRTFWASFSGWGLDGFDVQIYSFVIPALTSLWGISRSEAGLLATSALLISALGGWITGMLADRIGRVRLLQITILWFAVFTALSGLTQNFWQLLVVRGFQGFGFGGEWAAGSVLIGEVIRARHRGKAVGSVQSAWAWGWGAAAILATLIFELFPKEESWRYLFFLGILPAFAVFFIRRFVPEPDIFMASRSARGHRPSVWAIFGRDLWSTTLRGCLLATGVQGGYYAVTTFLPTFLRSERHLTVVGSGLYLAVIIIGSFVGYVASAYLNDGIGRRRNFFIFSGGALVTVIAYTQLQISDPVSLVLGFPLGFFISGIISGMGPILTELFPTSVRGTGQGFCYNFGRGIAAIIPFLVGYLGDVIPLGEAIGVLAGIAYAIVALAAFTLPETNRRELAVA
jgi:MFS family permease